MLTFVCVVKHSVAGRKPKLGSQLKKYEIHSSSFILDKLAHFVQILNRKQLMGSLHHHFQDLNSDKIDNTQVKLKTSLLNAISDGCLQKCLDALTTCSNVHLQILPCWSPEFTTQWRNENTRRVRQ